MVWLFVLRILLRKLLVDFDEIFDPEKEVIVSARWQQQSQQTFENTSTYVILSGDCAVTGTARPISVLPRG